MRKPQATLNDFMLVLLAAFRSDDFTVNPIQLGYGALGGDSLLGPLYAYWELRKAGVVYVDDHFQVRLSLLPVKPDPEKLAA